MTRPTPTRVLEAEALAAGYSTIAFCDEVGRGSAAGPLIVGAALAGTGTPPEGLADSKLLTARARAALEPQVAAWVADYRLGYVDAHEIDAIGMPASLRLAAHRALEGFGTSIDLVILDGPHDYIGAPYTVWARAKADQTEVGVAAASILAKEYRDRLMRALADEHPGYGFERNAGYLSAAHRAALAEHGPTPHHRTSWKFMDDLPQWAHLRRHLQDPALAVEPGPTLPV